MKTVSLKIDDLIFQETENILAKSKKPRNRYINEAIDYYNKYQKRLNIEKKLINESSLVAEESKIILSEFETIAYNYETI